MASGRGAGERREGAEGVRVDYALGFNEPFWLTRERIPATERLHLTERFTRNDCGTMTYLVTNDDPAAY
jgi:hypothetical protein